jgi:DNA-binding NtrC family response regulator
MTQSHTVLVVDDAQAIRLLCRVNLELDGHRVLEAGTIGAARQALDEDGDVSLVLLDVHVGADNGLEFLDELRNAHPELRVAMLTGSTDLDQVREHNPDGILGKPFELDHLRDVVSALANRRAGV